MANINEHKSTLSNSAVQVAIMEGLDHSGEFTEIDQVLPAMLSFTSS